MTRLSLLVILLCLPNLILSRVYIAGKDPECGRSKPRYTGGLKATVLHGDPVAPGEFPWHAAIIDRMSRPICGGALISENEVVTAAHCFDKIHYSDLKVILGVSDEFHRGKEFGIKQLYKHLLYEHYTKGFDLALLELDTPNVEFTEDILPICFPDMSKDLSFYYNTEVIVTGTGADEPNSNRPTRVVNKGILSIEDTKICWANSYILSHNIRRIPLTFCTKGTSGEHKHDTAKGDSGGPIVSKLRFDNQFELIGIVSASIELDNGTTSGHTLPSFHTDVLAHINWIIFNSEINDRCSIINRQCKSCTNASECQAFHPHLPYCHLGQCVECLDSSDCGGKECKFGRCEGYKFFPERHEWNNAMYGLFRRGRIPCSAQKFPYCGACENHFQCREIGLNFCVSGRCVECHSSESCGDRLCVGGKCVDCRTDRHCSYPEKCVNESCRIDDGGNNAEYTLPESGSNGTICPDGYQPNPMVNICQKIMYNG